MNKCPECGNTDIMHQSGEEICQTCGLVIEDYAFEQLIPEKNIYAEQPYLAKAGGQIIEGKIFKSVWLQTTREKNLNHALSKIELLGSKYNLPSTVIAESKLIFKKSLYSNISIGRDNTSLIYASIYIACNIHGIPKTPLELTINTEINKTQLMKGYRTIKKKLQINTPPIDPLDLLPRFASKLELQQKTIRVASELLIKIKENDQLSGSKPDTIIAGTIYAASKKTGENKTQRKISKATGITEVAIRKTSKKLCFVDNI